MSDSKVPLPNLDQESGAMPPVDPNTFAENGDGLSFRVRLVDGPNLGICDDEVGGGPGGLRLVDRAHDERSQNE